ncbi:MAG: TlpA family protein disulfide reductase [Bradymonadia bacterium]
MRALSAALALCLIACGGPAQSREGEVLRRQKAQLEQQVVQLNGQLQKMSGEMSALKDRLRLAEQRAGMAPFRPVSLKPLDHGRVDLGKATLVAHTSDRGRKQKIMQHLGRPRGVVLAFWATWCKPCTTPQELAHLKQLQIELEQVNGALVSMAVDDLKKVKADPRAPQWVYPLWQRDEAHVKLTPRSLIERAGMGLPLFLVVDGEGQVRWWRNAPLDEGVIEEMITAVARM